MLSSFIHREPLVNESKNRRQCPLLLTIFLGILSTVSLIALIVTVCVLLLVSKTSTTTVPTTVTTSTLSSYTTGKALVCTHCVVRVREKAINFMLIFKIIFKVMVGIPPLFRWNSPGTTMTGLVGSPGTGANLMSYLQNPFNIVVSVN